MSGELAISYFGDLEDDLFLSTFMFAAKDNVIGEKYNYYYSTDVSCASKLGLAAPGIILSRPYDDSPLTFSGSSYTELL